MILKRSFYRISVGSQSSLGKYRLHSHFNIEDKYPIVKSPIGSIIPTDSFYLENDFISETQEDLILDYISKILRNKKYQGNYYIYIYIYIYNLYLKTIHFFYEGTHWDNVISKYREIELQENDTPENISVILNSCKDKINNILKKDLDYLPVHVIDLAPKGFIGEYIYPFVSDYYFLFHLFNQYYLSIFFDTIKVLISIGIFFLFDNIHKISHFR